MKNLRNRLKTFVRNNNFVVQPVNWTKLLLESNQLKKKLYLPVSVSCQLASETQAQRSVLEHLTSCLGVLLLKGRVFEFFIKVLGNQKSHIQSVTIHVKYIPNKLQKTQALNLSIKRAQICLGNSTKAIT